MHCHKILVVEDDDAIRSAVVDLLALEGYEAVPAHHGKEALELLKERREDPCLILTDLMMPELDGWELIRLLEKQDIIITIPVVVMTAGLTGRLPVKRVIKKPFNLETILALVKEYCGSPSGGPITEPQSSL
jgi:CheY-like chemotaxis protein